MGWSGVNVGRQFPACFRKNFEMNRIFSFALVNCDKGPKEEINRQRITFSDSELDLADIETNGRPYSLLHFRCSFV